MFPCVISLHNQNSNIREYALTVTASLIFENHRPTRQPAKLRPEISAAGKCFSRRKSPRLIIQKAKKGGDLVRIPSPVFKRKYGY